MTLYLKYRPQKVDDLDLASVRESLSKMLSKEEIPHAFLFSGPKGTGKTSAARIVAKAINCESREKGSIEPCNVCSSCVSITKGENMDCLEIDAASHRGIDDIRYLREAVKLAPSSLSKKIYIIDEAHMLTTEACNALLKILEEPPSHVVFILATTNPEKLIDTIRSRTTVVSFTKATEEDVVRRLKKVSEGEGITVSEDVLHLIARGADGAFRDGVKLFEQVISEEIELTKEKVSEFLFGKTSFDPHQFLLLVSEKKTQESLFLIEQGITRGVSTKVMLRGILDILKEELFKEVKKEKGFYSFTKIELWRLLTLYSESYKSISGQYIEQLPFELATISFCDGDTNSENTHEKEPQKDTSSFQKKVDPPFSKVEPPVKKDEPAPAKEQKEKAKTDFHEPIAEEPKHPITSKTDTVIFAGQLIEDDVWTKILLSIRNKNAGTEALLRACKPLTYDGEKFIVGVFYTFHKERLESQQHRDVLEGVLEELLGKRPKVQCVLTEPPASKIQEEIRDENVVLTEAKVDNKIIDLAKDIFNS